MARLSEDSLEQLAGSGVQLPQYNRGALCSRIVHLGTGAFHRAHQVLYTEDVLDSFGGDWGICGDSLRRPRARDQLQPPQCLYTCVERDSDAQQLRIVAAVREVLVAPENPQEVIRRIADPRVTVVTLTVTEKGYCLDGKGEVDPEHEDIIHDLQHPEAPRSAVGYLCAGIRRRMEDAAGPLTVISCDNLSANGTRLRCAVLALAGRMSQPLAAWVEQHCSFPETMVDKIVPATSPAVLQDVERALGVRDEAAVVGEPFRQWVIQRDFAGPVPAWDKVGAEFVEDVAPYEAMKLGLLNASHSSIAYLGCLAGWETVAEAVQQPQMQRFIHHLMRFEIEPALQIPDGFDVHRYQDQLLHRFANRSLQHRTVQIAMDGSQKLPQRIFPALQWQLQRGGPVAALSLALAAWIRFTREAGLDDPLAGKMTELHRVAGPDPQSYLQAMLGLEEVFPRSLAQNPRLGALLLSQLQALQSDGVVNAIESLLDAQC